MAGNDSAKHILHQMQRFREYISFLTVASRHNEPKNINDRARGTATGVFLSKYHRSHDMATAKIKKETAIMKFDVLFFRRPKIKINTHSP
ncbi:hypothetical protein M5J15_03995 [Serratia symbiotica]|nr:hypothetical protein [Serratia symbiotica]USS96236.1 hypothetical protein M5J15_03995 [Serratia symbiotica]